MFFLQSSHKIVILSGAPHTDLSRDTALGRGVEEPVLSVAEGTPRALILLMPFVPFQPPKPAPGGPPRSFPGAENKNDFVGALKKNTQNKLALMG
jgi:hypothetical protein